MSTNENKKEDQKPQEAPQEAPKGEQKPADGTPEYKGNNPGGAASKQA